MSLLCTPLEDILFLASIVSSACQEGNICVTCVTFALLFSERDIIHFDELKSDLSRFLLRMSHGPSGY